MSKQKSSGKLGGNGRTRNFATVLYPDSENTPSDWLEILSDQKVPIIISPLHDQDVNPGGETKKSHYHVLLCFEGVKTQEQAKAIFDLVGGVGLEVVQSLRGYARYLCHLDNPEKHQYNTDEVKCLCGADFASIISLVTDKYKAIREMIEFCKDNNIVSLSDLIEWSMVEKYEWFRVICDNTIIIEKYLKARSWTMEHKIKERELIEKFAVSKDLLQKSIEDNLSDT